mgnify:CR=1 FL=1
MSRRIRSPEFSYTDVDGASLDSAERRIRYAAATLTAYTARDTTESAGLATALAAFRWEDPILEELHFAILDLLRDPG